MRKLFTLCLLIVSLSVTAQWQQTGSKVRYVNGLGIPTRDTAAGVAADSSQILIRPADSSLYVKYKRTWLRVGGGGGSIAGSGTTNYIPKFTSSSAIGNSQIFDNGTNVGINTITPTNKLDVFATNRTALNTLGSGVNVNYSGSNIGEFATIGFSWANSLGNNSTQWGMGMVGTNFVSGTAALNFFTNGSERMRITSAGNALIGTTTDNGTDRLQVSGSMNVSATATVNNLSSTNNITARTIFAGSDQAGSVDGLVVTAGNEKGFVINNTNTTGVASQSRFTFKNNGADRGLFYYSEAGQTFSFQSSGASRNIQIASEAGVGFYMTGANTNVRIGESVASNAPLSVNGFALINTNTNNSVDALQVNGAIQGNGLRQAYLARTTAYTITNNDYFIDCTSGTFTVTLPASSGRTGRIFVIKNSGTGTITVDGNAAETIDGAATYSLSVQYATIQLMSDGTNWKIIAKF